MCVVVVVVGGMTGAGGGRWVGRAVGCKDEGESHVHPYPYLVSNQPCSTTATHIPTYLDGGVGDGGPSYDGRAGAVHAVRGVRVGHEGAAGE